MRRSAPRSRSPGGNWRTARGSCAGRGWPARGAARARACRTASRRRRRTGSRRPPWRVQRRIGQRMAVRQIGGAADRGLFELEAQVEAAQHLQRLGDDLDADAVTGQDRDFHRCRLSFDVDAAAAGLSSASPIDQYLLAQFEQDIEHRRGITRQDQFQQLQQATLAHRIERRGVPGTTGWHRASAAGSATPVRTARNSAPSRAASTTSAAPEAGRAGCMSGADACHHTLFASQGLRSSRSVSKALILSAWRKVSAISSKPLSRQYLRNGWISNGSSAPSGLIDDLALEIDRQAVADECGSLVEQPATSASGSTIGSRPFLKQLL